MHRTISKVVTAIRTTLAILVICTSLASAQDFTANFEAMITEVNRSRYDKAALQLFPIQTAIRLELNNRFPKLDAGLQSRIKEMASGTAILSTIALLQTQMATKNYEDANAQALLLGIGLSGLWADVPSYRKLVFAQQDYKESPDVNTLRVLGYAAIDNQEWTLAQKVATDLLANPLSSRQSALTIRGLAELGQGNIAAAEKTLIESSKAPIGGNGPNLRLARALLDLDKLQTVDQFLAGIEQSTAPQSSKATDWRKDLAAGRRPDFGLLNLNN
ncbi:hypothetical protein [Bryobacter aggregatus]|uniref:hypothetical protein n=1 Tax=Bryobacter aggregatus TaxID=360054 RepID=UPI0012BA882D|nr:hypothetical protein [Bryobacter aggregatus]